MWQKWKNFLKWFLPPPTKAFNREVDRILGEIARKERETVSLLMEEIANRERNTVSVLMEEISRQERNTVSLLMEEISRQEGNTVSLLMEEMAKREQETVVSLMEEISRQEGNTVSLLMEEISKREQETVACLMEEISRQEGNTVSLLMEEISKREQETVACLMKEIARQEGNTVSLLMEEISKREQETVASLMEEISRQEGNTVSLLMEEKKQAISELKQDYQYNSQNHQKIFENYRKVLMREHKLLKQEIKKMKHLLLNDISEVKRKQLIVSLTSYPLRINVVDLVIKDMLIQTKVPDKILLWLSEDEFPKKEDDLPKKLISLQNSIFEIRWCSENLLSHKKYFYAMKEFPENIIITVDDDLRYKKNLIEDLYYSYLSFPYAVSGVRTHRIKFDEEGRIEAYRKWEKSCRTSDSPSYELFATTGAGTLFPPHSEHPEVFNEKNFKNLCFYADDIWLKVMQLMAHIPVVLTCPSNGDLHYIDGTQEDCLWNRNKTENDEQLENVLNQYDDYFGADNLLTERIKENFINMQGE